MRTDLGLWNTPKNHKWKGEYTKENEMKRMEELYHQNTLTKNLMCKILDFLTKNKE